MTHERKLAGTVDPYARSNMWAAQDRGYLSESYPASFSSGQTALSPAGTLNFVKLKLPSAASVTNVIIAVQAVGVTLTANQCIAGLWLNTGAANTLVGVTGDQSVAWVSTGIKTMALTGGPFSLAAGNYVVGFWYNGTTGPTIFKYGGTSGTMAGAGLASPNFPSGTADAGLTTAGAAPATMGAQASTANWWWAALS